MDASPLSPEKPPFDKLVAKVPRDLLQKPLGVQEGTLTASTVKKELRCDAEKLAIKLGLQPSRVSELIDAAEGDRKQQIGSILLGWVEDAGDRATVEALLRALYDTDETKTLERVVNNLGE